MSLVADQKKNYKVVITRKVSKRKRGKSTVLHIDLKCIVPAGIYMFKVNNRNTRTRCEICSKLTIKTPEPGHWRRSGVFIVNFKHISHLVLVFLLLTLSS